MSNRAAEQAEATGTESEPSSPVSTQLSADPDEEEGTPDRALFDAIVNNDIGAARTALAAGGNPNRSYIGSYVFTLAESQPLITLLYEHGAEVRKVKMSETARRLLVGLPGLYLTDDNDSDGNTSAPRKLNPLDRITKQQFDEGRSRRFGTSNPEKMDIPFWNAMVEAGCDAYTARKKFLDSESKKILDDDDGPKDTDDDDEEEEEEEEKGNNEQGATQTDQDNQIKVEDPTGETLSFDDPDVTFWNNPIWCTDRFGHSLTKLPNGTFVEIGGEHEDGYDPDFIIYNDVIVHHPDSTPENPKFDIYGYPEDVFAPTDFHSATFVPKLNAIFTIGSIGYDKEPEVEMKKRGITPVYKLKVGTWEMEKVHTTGEGPGFIRKHDAELKGSEIWVKGNDKSWKVDQAERYVTRDGKSESVRVSGNETWVLDLESMAWRREA